MALMALPYKLYGSKKWAHTAVTGKAESAIKRINTMNRSSLCSFAGVNRFGPKWRPILFNQRILPKRIIKSCKMPSGQITEQYKRPIPSVSTSSRAIVTSDSPNTDGHNCSLAIQPKYGRITAASRNSKLIPIINTHASAIRNARKGLFFVCFIF